MRFCEPFRQCVLYCSTELQSLSRFTILDTDWHMIFTIIRVTQQFEEFLKNILKFDLIYLVEYFQFIWIHHSCFRELLWKKYNCLIFSIMWIGWVRAGVICRTFHLTSSAGPGPAEEVKGKVRQGRRAGCPLDQRLEAVSLRRSLALLLPFLACLCTRFFPRDFSVHFLFQ